MKKAQLLKILNSIKRTLKRFQENQILKCILLADTFIRMFRNPNVALAEYEYDKQMDRTSVQIVSQLKSSNLPISQQDLEPQQDRYTPQDLANIPRAGDNSYLPILPGANGFQTVNIGPPISHLKPNNKGSFKPSVQATPKSEAIAKYQYRTTFGRAMTSDFQGGPGDPNDPGVPPDGVNFENNLNKINEMAEAERLKMKRLLHEYKSIKKKEESCPIEDSEIEKTKDKNLQQNRKKNSKKLILKKDLIIKRLGDQDLVIPYLQANKKVGYHGAAFGLPFDNTTRTTSNNI